MFTESGTSVSGWAFFSIASGAPDHIMGVMQRRLSLIAAVLAGLASSAMAGGCSEDAVTFPDGEGGGSEVAKQTEPAPGGVRRLLSRQYVSSVRLIFGDASAAAAVPPADLRVQRLASIGAATLAIPIAAVEQYDRSAEAIGRAFAEDADGLALRWPCSTGALERSCFEDFVSSAGRLAWRRPLRANEVAGIVDIAMDALTAYQSAPGDPFVEGVQFAVSTLLNAPEFLYIIELGEDDADDPKKRSLTQTELVTRLSFFLTDTTPDGALLDMAEASELATDESVRGLAAKLVERPAAKKALTAFFDEAYQLDRLPTVSKNIEAYPLWDEKVAAAMHEATLLFINDVIWGGDSRELMNADFAYVNDITAPFYGMTATGSDLKRVAMPARQPRRGLLGQAGILAIFSAAARSSPTKRGVFIQTALQCLTVPPPPPDVVPEFPEPDPNDPKTAKETLLEVHMEEPSCAGCHALFDPIGLAFESFDGVGMFRKKYDNGLTIDPTGEQSGLGAFEDAGEVADLLAKEVNTSRCLALNVFRNSMGHVETDGEEAALSAIDEAFATADFRIQDLLVEIVASPAFRLVGEPK